MATVAQSALDPQLHLSVSQQMDIVPLKGVDVSSHTIMKKSITLLARMETMRREICAPPQLISIRLSHNPDNGVIVDQSLVMTMHVSRGRG